MQLTTAPTLYKFLELKRIRYEVSYRLLVALESRKPVKVMARE